MRVRLPHRLPSTGPSAVWAGRRITSRMRLYLASILFGVGANHGNVRTTFERLVAATQRADQTQAFQQWQPASDMRFLFVGDSTALGIGAEDPSCSVAGHFGRMFPSAHVETYGQNAATTRDVVRMLQTTTLQADSYTLAVLQTGGNDAFQLVPRKDIIQSISDLTELLAPRVEHFALISGGNLGECLLIPRYLAPLLMRRSRLVHTLFQEFAASRTDMTYIEGFRINDPRLKDPQLYSNDLLHPSGRGYEYFAAEIIDALRKDGQSHLVNC
eukprot:m.303406 g.303406  ORF g.303406 m.303406 type:complete len:272 (-) comp15922_c0_seq1:248-1063(-)